MNCEQAQIVIHEYIDGELSSIQVEALEQHCADCKNCAKQLDQLVKQQAALKALPVPALSPELKNRLIKRAVRSAAKANKQASMLGVRPYKMLAAAMVAIMVIALSVFYRVDKPADATHFVAVGNQIHTIRVAINTAKALDGVVLRVDLSNNLELDGFGNKKQISWTTGLRKGVNVISLPIIGIASGKGSIITHIQLNGKEKIMHIRTLYKQPGSASYQPKMTMQS